MLKYHVIVLWNGNNVLEGDMTAPMVNDVARMMQGNFAGVAARAFFTREHELLRDYLFGGPADCGSQHDMLFGDETGCVSIRVVAK